MDEKKIATEKRKQQRKNQNDTRREKALITNRESMRVKRKERDDEQKETDLIEDRESKRVKRKETTDEQKETEASEARERMRGQRSAVRGSKPFHDAATNINTALRLFYEMGASSKPEDMESALRPISAEETKTLTEAYRSAMSPHCTIYGCAICGVRVILEEQQEIPDQRKIPISRLCRLKVPNEFIAKHRLSENNFANTKSFDVILVVNSNPEVNPLTVSMYFLHGRYMNQPPVPVQFQQSIPLSVFEESTMAIACEECTRIIQVNEDRLPKYSIANGCHLGVNARSMLPKLSVFELTAIKKFRLFRNIVKVIGKSMDLAVQGHVIALANEACIDFQNKDEINSLRVPKDQKTNLPILPFVSSSDLSICFVGKFDIWNRIIAPDPETNRPQILSSYHRIFAIDFKKVIIWLKFLKTHTLLYENIIIDDSPECQIRLEDMQLQVIQSAHIAESDDVIEVQRQSTMNHPNAPSSSDDIENENEIKRSTGNVTNEPGSATTNLVFGSIDFSFVESNIPIEATTNPEILKPLLQKISDTLQIFATSQSPMQSPQMASPSNILQSMTLQIPREPFSVETPTKNSTQSDNNSAIIRTPLTPIKVLSPICLQTMDISPPIPESSIEIEHGTELLNEYTNSKELRTGAFPTLFIDDSDETVFGTSVFTDTDLKHLINQADNAFANDFEFVFYAFNQRARTATAQGVRAKFKPGSTNMSRLLAIVNEDNFLGKLADAVENPTSMEAKEILRRLLPLIHIAGKHIPFGEAGASDKALSEMINLHRMFGTWAYFFTCNPVMQDYPLALRVSHPVMNNWDDLCRELFPIPVSSSERRHILENSPIGASYVYQLLYKGILKSLIGLPQAPIGSTLKSTVLPPDYRDIKRGIFGPASGYFLAQELSKAKVQHFHSLIMSPINWSFYRCLQIQDPHINTTIGNYFDSMITSCFPLDDLDQEHPNRWNAEICKQPWNSDPTSLILNTPSDPNSSLYSKQFLYLASHKQNHEFHNHSCFKFKPKVQKDLTQCRFAMPFQSWDQQSGLQQLIVLRPEQAGISKQVKVLLQPEAPPNINIGPFQSDTRLLVPILYRQSLTTRPMRSHDSVYNSIQNRFISDYGVVHDDSDPPSINGYFTDCSKTVTMATYGAQNNVQIADGNLGVATYIANYIKKGDTMKLNAIMPLLLEAAQVSKERPSVRQDNTNPDVMAQRLMNRFVNNHGLHLEASIRLCLSKLLGMAQFETSHTFGYIFPFGALASIRQRDQQEALQPMETQSMNDDETSAVTEAQSQADDLNQELMVDLGWQMDITEEGYGEVVKNEEGLPMIVSQEIDYKYRPTALSHLNLMEFICLTQKTRKRNDLQDQMNLDFGMINPLSSSVDEMVTNDDNMPAIDETNDANISTTTPILSRKLGRPLNQTWHFHENHPQHATHEIKLVSRIKVPFLAGEKVPTFPLQEDVSIEEVDQAELNKFGAYFVVLLCPWNLHTYKPNYALTYDGLLHMIESWNLDDENAGNYHTNKGRMKYIQNCIECMGGVTPIRFASFAVTKFRTRAATKYGAYQLELESRQKQRGMGKKSMNSDGDDVDDDDDDDDAASGHSDNNNDDDEEAAKVKSSAKSSRQLIEENAHQVINLLRQRYEENLDQKTSNAKCLQQHDDENLIRNVSAILPSADESLIHQDQTRSHYSKVTMNVSSSTKISYVERMSMKIVSHIDLKQQWENVIEKFVPTFEMTKEEQEKASKSNIKSIRTKSRQKEDDILDQMNTEQRQVYSKFLNAVKTSGTLTSKPIQLLELVTGPPGTGKSFLIGANAGLFLPNERVITAPSAKAALIHHTLQASTVQSEFKLGILKAFQALNRDDRLEMFNKYESIRLLIIDELLMNDALVFGLVNQRLQEIFSDDKIRKNLPFAGIHVLLCGDENQLPPIGSSLVKAALDGTPAGKLLRLFHLTPLTIQMRSQDPAHSAMISKFIDRSVTYPISVDMLQETCHHCSLNGSPTKRKAQPTDHNSGDDNCPLICPHRCVHFKVLSVEDVQNDPLWNYENIRFVTCLNSTADNWNIYALQQLAIKQKVPILRYRLQLHSSNRFGQKHIQLCLTDEEADRHPGLWGYYVLNAPVTVTYNINTPKGIANGTEGFMSSITWESQEHMERQKDDIINAGPGEIVTLKHPPTAILVRLKHDNESIIPFTFKAIDKLAKLARAIEVKISKNITIKLIGSGLKFGFSSTVHGVQGSTVDRILINANFSPNFATGLSLNGIYVATSRVKQAAHVRVVPWIEKDPRKRLHLLSLKHNSDNIRFAKCYTKEGKFDESLIEPEEQIGSPLSLVKKKKYQKKIVTISTSSHQPVSSMALTAQKPKPVATPSRPLRQNRPSMLSGSTKSSKKSSSNNPFSTPPPTIQPTIQTRSRSRQPIEREPVEPIQRSIFEDNLRLPKVRESLKNLFPTLPGLTVDEIYPVYLKTFLIDWKKCEGISYDNKIKLRLYARFDVDLTSVDTRLYANSNSLAKFCIDMHLIAHRAITDFLEAHQNTRVFSAEDAKSEWMLSYLTAKISDYLKVSQIIAQQYGNEDFYETGYLELFRTCDDDPRSWGYTIGDGFCGYRACLQMEKRLQYLIETYGRLNNIPTADFPNINGLSRDRWQLLGRTQQERQETASFIEHRLLSLPNNPGNGSAIANAVQFLREVRQSETRPFLPREFWFDHLSIEPWFRRVIQEDYQDSVDISYVIFQESDYETHQDIYFGAVHSGLTNQFTYHYAMAEKIVSSGFYIKFSPTQRHFAIEPMVDTVSELVSLKEALQDLSANIANVLAEYSITLIEFLDVLRV